MPRITRRNFLQASATAAVLAGLAGCVPSNTSVLTAPDVTSYPIEAEEWGSGSPKWEKAETPDGWTHVFNGDGPELGYTADSGLKLIQVGGYAFKDLNGNGKLDVFEDWRQDPDIRAEALASEISLSQIAGLMVFDGSFSAGAKELTNEEKASLDEGVRGVQNGGLSLTPVENASWSNIMQAYAERSNLSIPVDFCSDPRNSGWGIGVSPYPDNLALASTFSPSVATAAYREMAREYRALGVTTLLGPQTDLCSEPRWGRNTAAFGEDPALARDMLRSAVDALQSTYAESGEDIGWGNESICTLMKHYPGDGAAQSGRESHDSTGQYNIYPGNNFKAHLVSFLDGGLHLEGKTGEASGIMPSYSIAWSEDGEYGELVGSSFSKYKLGILRNACSYDGVICTDWQVIDDNGKNWGVESLTPAERAAKALSAGVDQFGGGSPTPAVREGIGILQDSQGKDAVDTLIRNSGRRLLRNRFRQGMFENPYVDVAKARSIVSNNASTEEAMAQQTQTIIMLKNDGTISKASEERKRVYVPLVFTPATIGFVGQNFSSADLPVDMETLEEYFDVVTDAVGDPTGEPGEDGKPSLQYSDIIRATPEELSDCDYALVFTRTPKNTSFWSITGGFNMFTQEYVPLSLQYGEYVADGPNVPEKSVAGRTIDNKQENQTYFGKKALVDNSTDLDMILYAQKSMPEGAKVIVAVNAEGKAPLAHMVMGEFEAGANAILYGFNINNKAFLDIVSGRVEPSGLLPIQLPANMETVEAQLEDVPRDMECYVDTDGNEYDFGFGLNWSGTISDDRTERYCVKPLTGPETIEI